MSMPLSNLFVSSSVSAPALFPKGKSSLLIFRCYFFMISRVYTQIVFRRMYVPHQAHRDQRAEELLRD